MLLKFSLELLILSFTYPNCYYFVYCFDLNSSHLHLHYKLGVLTKSFTIQHVRYIIVSVFIIFDFLLFYSFFLLSFFSCCFQPYFINLNLPLRILILVQQNFPKYQLILLTIGFSFYEIIFFIFSYRPYVLLKYALQVDDLMGSFFYSKGRCTILLLFIHQVRLIYFLNLQEQVNYFSMLFV